MRQCLAILWVFLLLASSADSVWAYKHPKNLKLIESLETKAGETLFIKLPGNPGIGYEYKLNKELSSGLDLVDIKFLGWLMTSESQSVFFRKRDLMNIAVHTKAPGLTKLAFDYYRKMAGRTRSTTRLVRINIKPSRNRQ